MRVVAIADTHQFHDELVLPPGDVLLSAGDAGRGGDVDELGGFFEWLSDQPHALKVFVPGNHDGCLQHPAVLTRMRAAFPAVRILVDEALVIDGIRWWGSPWTPLHFDWAFMHPRGPKLAERWACIPDDTDVLVTHGPPQHILDDVAAYRFGRGVLDGIDGDLAHDDRYAGCADLRARVRVVRPRLHLFGHIHSQKGVVDDDGTTFVNCTTNECELPPAVIDVVRADGAVRVTVVG
jgi:Icc-related predicted phosphoesterase